MNTQWIRKAHDLTDHVVDWLLDIALDPRMNVPNALFPRLRVFRFLRTQQGLQKVQNTITGANETCR